jgi:hypothetical protein
MVLNLGIFFDQIVHLSMQIWSRFLEIIYSPLVFKDMLWILIPLLVTMLFIEFYFGFYVEEQLGWNTAFGNTLVLMFVSLNLGKQLYDSGLLFNDQLKTIIVMAVLIEAVLIGFFDFFHILPERFAFKISGTLPINFVAISAIIIVYTNVPIDPITLSALVLLLITLAAFIGLIHLIEPKVGNPHLYDD